MPPALPAMMLEGISHGGELAGIPCDFAEHLSQRLGMSSNGARQLLAHWISGYEPRTRRPIAELCAATHASTLIDTELLAYRSSSDSRP